MTHSFSLSQTASVSGEKAVIHCCYINTTNRLQILQVKHGSHKQLERVVFPGERLIFETVPEANLFIYTSEHNYVTVPCQQLHITEPFPKSNFLVTYSLN